MYYQNLVTEAGHSSQLSRPPPAPFPVCFGSTIKEAKQGYCCTDGPHPSSLTLAQITLTLITLTLITLTLTLTITLTLTLTLT